MREHMGLFRGKRTDNGEWVKGFYAHFVNLYKGRETYRIYRLFAESDCGEFYPDWYEVDPDTIGEYTGLTDKDDKPIFEGDILRYGLRCDYECYLESLECPDAYDGEVYDADIETDVVEWCVGYDYPAFDLKDNPFECNGLAKLMCGEYEYEIIGNIHDNPELLKGGADNALNRC